jgi:glutamate synthase domain-containing protein 1
VFFFNPHHVSGGTKIAEAALHHRGLQVTAWRDVPVDPDSLGDHARLTMPRIMQAIIKQQSVVSSQSSAVSRQQFELQLYLARKEFERGQSKPISRSTFLAVVAHDRSTKVSCWRASRILSRSQRR